MDSYFSDVSPIPDSENPQWIKYLRGNAYDPLDNGYHQLKSDIDDGMLTINAILPMDTSQRKLIFLRLLSAARNGLIGEHPQLVLDQQELKVAKQQLVEAARSVRSDFIRRTFVVTILACVVGFGGHIVLSIYESTMQKLMKPEQFLLLRSVLVSLPGIGIANLFYTMIRNQNISYENLRLMDEYRFHPLERFGYIFIVTIVMGILLYFNVVTLGLAGIILNEFKTNPEYALIIALVCGLSEPIVINIVRDVSRPKAQPDTLAKPVAST